MKLLKKILPLALVVMGMAGCLKEQYEPVPAGRGGEVTLRVSVPGMATPSTRAFGEAQEKQVETLDVLVFNSDNKLVQWKAVASADINPGGDGLALKIRDLAETDGITIAVVANASAEVGTMLTALGGVAAGPLKTAVLDKLTYAFTGARWVTEGAGAMYLPMYGEVAVSGNVYASASQAVEMKRMVAKIDVTNAVAATFKLTAVHLVNHNQAGYVAPKWDGTGAPVTESPQMPWIPASPNKKAWTGETDAQTYTVDAPVAGAQSLTGEIYTFESLAAYNASEDPKAANPAAPATATRLILEGEYAGGTYWYPVDFVYPQDGTAKTTKYMPLLRNHRYVVSIDAAEGKGYGTMGEAVAAYSALTNLKTRIIAYDEGKLRYMAFDGQYMIGVESRTVAISKEAQTVALALFTDNPAGWSASIALDAADGAGWLNIGGNSSATGAVGSATLNLTATANTLGRARTATVTLTAGRNRSVAVTVTQSDESQYYIRITDENGTEIDGLTFGYYGATESDDPAAQRFYVSYNLPGNVTITEQGTGTFSYTPSSDKPATVGTITGGAAMFNVQSAKASAADLTDPFFTKSTTLVFTGSDDTNTVTKNFELKQGGYNLVTDAKAFYVLGAQTETIYVRANFLWEIIGVTDNDNVLQNESNLIGLPGGNNITTGDAVQFTMSAETIDGSKTGKTATITFRNKADGSIYTVTIIASDELYVGYFAGNLVADVNGVWQFERRLFVQREDASTGIMWLTGMSWSGAATDDTNGKLSTWNLRTADAPAAKFCFTKNGTVASETDVNYIWYLPAQKQLMAVWAVQNSFYAIYRFSVGNSYWSATEYSVSGSWYVLGTGSTNSNPKNVNRQARCVREL